MFLCGQFNGCVIWGKNLIHEAHLYILDYNYNSNYYYKVKRKREKKFEHFI